MIGNSNARTAIEAESESIEWHQCPELPRRFVDEVTYDPNDYTTSQIEDYAPAEPIPSNYKPIGTTVDGKTFYNEIPNIATPFTTDKRFGTVKPLDNVRYINTPYAVNVRDLGGWECDGGTVKYGMLFRGGEPNAADRSVLVDECGIRHDLNLRGAEATWSVSPLGEDIHFTRDDDYNWYSLTNTKAWKTNLRCVFDAVTHNEPVYFHCAIGADRTGTLACVLEGILGMSQSDIDKDYELTTFYIGCEDDLHARRRNETDWTNLINAINAKQGDSFRDRCIQFVAEIGFTADEINAYRIAMIDGTPETIALNTADYSVTNTLDGVATSNDSETAKEYQPYEAKLSVPLGYIIGDVKITMDGVDVTDMVFSGGKENLKHKVTQSADNCTIESRKTVIDGQDLTAKILPNSGYILSDIKITMDGVDITADAFYGTVTKRKHNISKNATNCTITSANYAVEGEEFTATIVPNTGYTMSGGTITIIMGGIDVSNYYSNGVVSIPNVSGDIVITATAVEQVVEYTNLADPTDSDWLDDKRVNSSFEIVDYTGGIVTNFIPCQIGDTLRVKGLDFESNALYGRILLYANKDDILSSYPMMYPLTEYTPGNSLALINNVLNIDAEGVVSWTVGMLGDGSMLNKTIAYLRIIGEPTGTNDEIIITINEEIE